MSTETIGNWNVKLSVDALGFTQGMDAVAKRSARFVQEATAHSRLMSQVAGNSLVNFARVDLSPQLGQISRLGQELQNIAAGAATGGWIGALAASGGLVGAMMDLTNRSMDAIAAQTSLGRTVGLTAQQMAGLQLAARETGIDAETLSQSLAAWPLQIGKLNHELQAGNTGPIVTALERMGINAREFAAAELPRQFAMVAEGSQRINNAAERNAAVFAALGEQGRRLAPLTRMNAAEFGNLANRARAAGYEISQAEADMVLRATRSSRALKASLETAWEGQMKNLAVAWAPFSEQLMRTLERSRPAVSTWSSTVGKELAELTQQTWAATAAMVDFADASADWIGGVNPARSRDYLAGLTTDNAFIQLMNRSNPRQQQGGDVFGVIAMLQQSNPQLMQDRLRERINQLASSNNPLIPPSFIAAMQQQVQLQQQQLSGITELSERLNRQAASVGQSAGFVAYQQAAMSGQYSPQQLNVIADAYDRIAEAERRLQVRNLSNELLIRANQSGMTEFERIADTARINGATAAEQSLLAVILRQVEAREEQTREMERQRQLREQVFRETESPIEAMQRRIQELNDLETPLNPATYGRAITRIFSDFESAAGTTQQRSPGAVLAGTVAEQAAIAQAQRDARNSSRDPVERLRVLMEQQRQVQVQQREQFAELVRLARNGFVAQMGN